MDSCVVLQSFMCNHRPPFHSQLSPIAVRNLSYSLLGFSPACHVITLGVQKVYYWVGFWVWSSESQGSGICSKLSAVWETVFEGWKGTLIG